MPMPWTGFANKLSTRSVISRRANYSVFTNGFFKGSVPGMPVFTAVCPSDWRDLAPFFQILEKYLISWTNFSNGCRVLPTFTQLILPPKLITVWSPSIHLSTATGELPVCS